MSRIDPGSIKLKGRPMGPCYGPLLDSAGTCSLGPQFGI